MATSELASASKCIETTLPRGDLRGVSLADIGDAFCAFMNRAFRESTDVDAAFAVLSVEHVGDGFMLVQSQSQSPSQTTWRCDGVFPRNLAVDAAWATLYMQHVVSRFADALGSEPLPNVASKLQADVRGALDYLRRQV